MSTPWQDLTAFVHDQWSRLRVRGARNQLREDAIRHAIERAVDLANPRIRGLNGYRRLLREPIARCLDYSEELARRVPGPVRLNRQTWAEDPLLNSLFGDPSRIRWAVSSTDCRDYMGKTALMTGDCYAILLALPVFRHQLGIELNGETLQRDIAQTTLSFDNIEVILAAGNPETVRAKTAGAIMDALVEFAAQEIGRQQARIEELEESLRIVRIKQKVVSPVSHGLEILRDDGAAHTTEYQIIGNEIKDLERALAAAHQGLSTLNDYLDRFAALLRTPETLIAARPERTRLDRMNVVRQEREEDPQSAEIEYLRAYHGERAGRMVLMVRFARAELVSDQERLTQVERFFSA